MTDRVPMKGCLAISIIAVLLTGCVQTRSERADIANRAKQSLVGMSRRDLLSCAGVPTRQATDGATEFLTYVGGGDSEGVAVMPSGSSVAVASSHRRYCEATFVIENGAVTKVNYAGRTGGTSTKGEQCYFIVEDCVGTK